MITNPILKGFNPDPSICYANGRYYIAVSTFEYFPGVTIYESEDLSNWVYCTSVLTRESQLPLSACKNSSGIYAPTIRYYDGTFYLVTTNKNIPMNFLVTAKQIKGPWSEMMPIHTKGIDPSLYFDEDGSCFYTSNGLIDGKKTIMGAYINEKTGELLEPLRIISYGVNGCATEAPHIYRHNGWFYLLVAEGGTSYGHHANILRSKNIYGPYEPNPKNPILSHSYRKGHPIQATGHVDLVRTFKGEWFAVFLGIRPFGRAHLHNLGRESFLAPVTWKDGWPIIGEDGRVEMQYPLIRGSNPTKLQTEVDFSQPLDQYPLLKVRTPKQHCYLQTGGKLMLDGQAMLDTEKGEPTLLCLRQPSFKCTFSATLAVGNLEGTAGIVAWYNSDYHLKLAVQRAGEDNLSLSLVCRVHDLQSIQATVTIPVTGEESIYLRCISNRTSYTFYCNNHLVGSASIACLSTEATMYMTFTGTLFGIYSEQGNATFLSPLTLIEDDDK
jgi:alpha-N-arabinofuranosidase|nr:family 43 glycosylhydrolase [uncultured Sphaerochaeta sp.]